MPIRLSFRNAVFTTVLIGFSAVGCKVAPRDGIVASDRTTATLAPDVDPTRAFLPLNKLPSVTRPESPDTLAPLNERAAPLIASAASLASQQRYTEAILELEKGLRFDPKHPDLHRALALLHLESGNMERARTSAQRALDGNPDDAITQFVMGRCAAQRGDSETELLAYRTALVCNNFSDFETDAETAALIHYYLAQTLTASGYYEAALEQYRALQDLVSSRPFTAKSPELNAALQGKSRAILLAESGILEKLGRFETAANRLNPLLQESSVDDGLRIRHARLLLKAGKVDEAWVAARAVETNDSEIFALLREIHEKSVDSQPWVADLERRLSAKPQDPYLILELATTLLRLGRRTEGIQRLATYLELQPEANAVRMELLDQLVVEKKWMDYLRVAAGGVLAQPTQSEAWEQRMSGLSAHPDAVKAILEESVDPSTPATTYLQGILAIAEHKVELAESFFRRSLTQDASFVPTRVALAVLFIDLYRYEDAITVAARKEESTAEDARLEFLLGQVYERLDDASKAAQHWKAASQLRPSDPRAAFELAKLYRRSDDTLSSQRQLRTLLEREPAHVEAREMLAMLYVNEGKLDVAAQQFEELKRRTTSPMARARAQANLDLLRQRDPEVYRQALRAAAEQFGPDVETWYTLAESYSEFEQVQAREAYLNVLSLDPNHESALLGVIFAEQRLLHYDVAAERFSKLLPRRPNRHTWRLGWPGSSWRLGMLELYLVLQDHESALRMAREQADRADIDDQTRTRYRMILAETLDAAGQSGEAVALLETFANQPGGDKTWRNSLAELYLQREETSKALPLLEKAVQEKPTDQVAKRNWVDGLIAASQFDRASQQVLDWLTADPEKEEAFLMMIVVLNRQGRHADAIELVRGKLPYAQNRERYQDLYVGILDAAKRHLEAVDWVESLLAEFMNAVAAAQDMQRRRPPQPITPDRLALRPNEPNTSPQMENRLIRLRQELVSQLVAAKKFRDAESQVREWLEDARNPESRYEYLLTLAQCQREQGDELGAFEAVEMALAFHPEHVTLNNDVAYGLVERGTRLDEAERMIRYSLSREPRQMAYLDTFGWLRYKQGEFVEARKWLERASRSGPRADPVVLDHLGDACWRAGDFQTAIQHWSAALTALKDGKKKEWTAEEKRVESTAQGKIDDVLASRTPTVASLAAPEAEATKERDNQGP
ncbi:MAG: tetratricopeptide repeat protein [Planctomycetota bacterium]